MNTSQEKHFEYYLHDGFYYECIFHKATREAVDGWYQFMRATIGERDAIGFSIFMVDITASGLPPLNAFSARLRDYRQNYPTKEKSITAVLYKDSFVMTLASNLLQVWGTDPKRSQQRFFNVRQPSERAQAVTWVHSSYEQLQEGQQTP